MCIYSSPNLRMKFSQNIYGSLNPTIYVHMCLSIFEPNFRMKF